MWDSRQRRTDQRLEKLDFHEAEEKFSDLLKKKKTYEEKMVAQEASRLPAVDERL